MCIALEAMLGQRFLHHFSDGSFSSNRLSIATAFLAAAGLGSIHVVYFVYFGGLFDLFIFK